MAIKAKQSGSDADIIRNITLYVFLTKIVLTKSGEIDINCITSAREEKIENNTSTRINSSNRAVFNFLEKYKFM